MRASRAGRTGRGWYGEYVVRYADPTAEGGVRRMSGHTNKRQAISSARGLAERGEAAWATVVGRGPGGGSDEEIARFPKKSSRQARSDRLAGMAKKPRIAYWVHARGRGGRESEPVYVLGTCRRTDEGIVGHDLCVRPLRLGKGPYTMVVSPDDVEEKP